MVNNFTNINKPNYHLSSQRIEHRQNTHMTWEIQIKAWDEHTYVAVLNRLTAPALQICIAVTALSTEDKSMRHRCWQ